MGLAGDRGHPVVADGEVISPANHEYRIIPADDESGWVVVETWRCLDKESTWESSVRVFTDIRELVKWLTEEEG